jgi:hypothetical protein
MLDLCFNIIALSFLLPVSVSQSALYLKEDGYVGVIGVRINIGTCSWCIYIFCMESHHWSINSIKLHVHLHEGRKKGRNGMHPLHLSIHFSPFYVIDPNHDHQTNQPER